MAHMAFTATILLLGSGELGREFTISAKRLGARVIACDAYEGAPAMQVADKACVFSMLNGEALRRAVLEHKPDYIVPEIEAIRTEVLIELEREGYNVVPSAKAAQLTMNRDAIRDLAARDLGLVTSHYRYASSLEELREGAAACGFPCIVKPVMSSSGKGQTQLESADGLEAAWDYACAHMRGDRQRVIVEGFIHFDYEITLLSIAHEGGITFCPPIGHRQERGDYQESWQPAAMSAHALAQAQAMAARIIGALKGEGRGWGIFGVEFFVRRRGGDEAGEDVIFSELSPRPHDTGMVTMAGQSLSQFDLHARAVLGLPIPHSITAQPSASSVILADRESSDFAYHGIDEALQVAENEGTPASLDLRIFGKPTTRPYRRMGVALAGAETVEEARRAANQSARGVTIRYND